MGRKHSYHNSKSVKEHYKKENKRKENSSRKLTDNKTKKSTKTNNKKKTKTVDNNKKKNNIKPTVNVSKTPAEYIFGSNEFRNIELTIPVKFNLFGKLTRESKMLICNCISVNRDWMCSDKSEFKPNSLDVINYSSKLVDKITKRKTHNPYYSIHSTKCNNKHYYALGINLQRFFVDYFINSYHDKKSMPVYLEIKTNIYDNVDITKIPSVPDYNKFNSRMSIVNSVYTYILDTTSNYRLYINEKDKINELRYTQLSEVRKLISDPYYFRRIAVKRIDLHK